MIECCTQPTAAAAAAGPIPTKSFHRHLYNCLRPPSDHQKHLRYVCRSGKRASAFSADSKRLRGGRRGTSSSPLPGFLSLILTTITISCQVGDRVGSVQWTRDGLTLGYDRDLPGFDRYSVLGTDEAGTYNLEVSFFFWHIIT